MAITFTAGTPSESTGSVTSLTPALPAGLTTGDYTIMVCALNATAGTITPPGGATWTAILPSTGATQNTADVHAIYYRKWQAGDANPTFTCTSGRFAILPIKVSGADTTTFVNTAVAVTHTGAATTTVIAPTITPSSVQLCCTFNGRHASNGIFVNFSTPAGMTEVGECVGKSPTQTNAGASFCQQTVTSGVATGTRTSTASVAVTGGMGTSFALNVAAGGGPVTATLTGTTPAVTGAVTATQGQVASVAGTTPTTTGALTAQQRQTASLAGTTPAVTGALTATQRQVASVTAATPAVTGSLNATVATFMTASLTGVTPAVTGALTAVTLTPILPTLSGVTPAVTGALTAQQRNVASLTGTTPTTTGALTATQRQAATLAANTPAVTGALTATQRQTATLAGTTPVVTAVITTAGGVPPTVATLTAVTPIVTGALTATQQQQAALAGTTAATLGSLVAAQRQPATLAGVTPGVAGTMAAAQHEPATLGGTTPAVTTDLTVTFTLRLFLTGTTPAVTGLFVAAGLGKPAEQPHLVVTGPDGTATVTSSRGGAQVPPYAGTVRVVALTGSVQMEEA